MHFAPKLATKTSPALLTGDEAAQPRVRVRGWSSHMSNAKPAPSNNSPTLLTSAVDDDGHTFSPALRAQQKEVATVYSAAPALVAQANAEFDQAFAQGLGLYESGDPSGARERFVACYVLARELGHTHGEADALNLAALCYLDLGEAEPALEYFRGSRRLCEAVDDARGAAVALGNVGRALAALRRTEEAEEALCLAADAAAKLPDYGMWVHALGRLGTLQLQRRRLVEARKTLAQAVGLAAALDDPHVEAPLLQRLAAALAPAPAQAPNDAEEGALAPAPPLASSGGARHGEGGEDGAGAPSVPNRVGPPDGAASGGNAGGGGGAGDRVFPSNAPSQQPGADAGGAASQSARGDRRHNAPESDAPAGTSGAGASQGEASRLSHDASVNLLRRAVRLASDGEGARLKLQVLQQLRAMHLRLGDAEEAAACEGEMDRLGEQRGV